MQENQIIGTFDSKSGKRVVVRTLSMDDVMALLEYVNTLSAEDTYLLMSGEQFTKSQEEKHVRQCVDHMLAGDRIQLLCFIGDQLVANGHVRRMTELRRRALHVGELGLSIHKDFRSDGIGSILMNCLLDEVKKMKDIRLLRLWVFGPNEKAKNLYKKFGFRKCGSVPESINYRGKYISHDLMHLRLQTHI